MVIAAAGRDMAARLMQIVRGASAEGDTTPMAGMARGCWASPITQS